MSSVDVRVISIGAMDAHSEWGEQVPVRTGHATCTLVRSEDRVILVDPSLPGEVLNARLGERAGIDISKVTDVFLTSFRPDVRRGLTAFDDARWLIAERERESIGIALVQQLGKAEEARDKELEDVFRTDIGLLRRCEPAPDKLADRVDLFPMPGVTPGSAGLLIADTRHTLLIAGDTVASTEHLDAGRVVKWAGDAAAAQESFQEAIEIADLIVPGRDNLLVNPTKRPF